MPEKLSEEQIAELERLDRDATPGPWEAPDVAQHGAFYQHVVYGPNPWDPSNKTLLTANTAAVAAFCAAARNALPALLAEVREFRRRQAAVDADADYMPVVQVTREELAATLDDPRMYGTDYKTLAAELAHALEEEAADCAKSSAPCCCGHPDRDALIAKAQEAGLI